VGQVALGDGGHCGRGWAADLLPVCDMYDCRRFSVLLPRKQCILQDNKTTVLAGPPQCVSSYSSGPCCLSVCHTWISPKQSEIDIWLLGNSNRNPGFPIQNLIRDLKYGSAILGVSGTSHIQTEMGQLG